VKFGRLGHSLWQNTNSAMKEDTADREIRNSRVFEYPRARVFGAFSNPDVLARWWGPKGFSNTFHSFDFQPGGQWQFTMHGPDGHDFKNESVFKEISGPGRIVIEHVSAPRFLLEVTLSEAGEGTLLTWTQRFETPEIRDAIAKFAGNANEENLDRLAAVLA
jgi:uncharacterized protein YndB with AHSA1/START domain